MSNQFLTLEGPDDQPRRPRRPSMLETLMSLGAVDEATASARRAADVAKHAATTEAKEEQWYREHTSGESSKIADREELWKPAEYDLTDRAPSLFAHYGIQGLEEYKERDLGEIALLGLIQNGAILTHPLDYDEVDALGELAAYALMSCTPEGPLDEGLAWGWGNITRMFTPPRSVRQTFSDAFKSVSKVSVAKITRPFQKFAIPKNFSKSFSKIGKVAVKGLKMAGAVATLPQTLWAGKARNQIFGLKGNEMKMFDAAAKAGRMVAVAVGSVVGGPAIAGSLSKTAAGPLTKYLASAGGKSFLGQGAIGKLGSIIIKDAVKGQIMRVVKDAGGKLVGNTFNKSQVPAEVYDSLPDNQPVSTLVNQEDVQQPAYIAGTGSMDPSGGLTPPQQYGELRPFPEQAREQSMSDIAETRLNPEDRTAFLPPSQAERYNRAEEEDELPLRELINRAKYKNASPTPPAEVETSNGEPSLGSIIQENRRRKLRTQIDRLKAQRRA